MFGRGFGRLNVTCPDVREVWGADLIRTSLLSHSVQGCLDMSRGSVVAN